MIPAPTVDALSAYPAGTWPLCSHLRLPAVTEAVPIARHHTRLKLARWGLYDHLDAVQLVVSEMVTNAVQAAAGTPRPYLRMWLCADQDAVLVQVWEAADQLPVWRDADPDADHGRGLIIVSALSKDCGWYRPAALPGKIVWSVIAG